jgi:hypothetical protein
MTRATFTIAVVFLCSTAVGEQPTVIFLSPCECQGFHSKNRWVTKTDLTPVPSDKSAIQSVTPSQIYAWEGLGPDVKLTATSNRLPTEQKWYALTGRVVDAKVEADGDIHIALVDATGNTPERLARKFPLARSGADSVWLDDDRHYTHTAAGYSVTLISSPDARLELRSRLSAEARDRF